MFVSVPLYKSCALPYSNILSSVLSRGPLPANFLWRGRVQRITLHRKSDSGLPCVFSDRSLCCSRTNHLCLYSSTAAWVGFRRYFCTLYDTHIRSMYRSCCTSFFEVLENKYCRYIYMMCTWTHVLLGSFLLYYCCFLFILRAGRPGVYHSGSLLNLLVISLQVRFALRALSCNFTVESVSFVRARRDGIAEPDSKKPSTAAQQEKSVSDNTKILRVRSIRQKRKSSCDLPPLV